ncbi:efflux transporter outer membrane subunit [Sphingomonas japonica]|uniref:NodT family efflux transporter outer membrane factor (OMF) lipoprotein n=1 Tax=Sphingomonas japonica TaxID=511662 RepID=A0ABX0U223_9SPHN|nr:efflux transporter outer membrane subunit [Sphingomonas japonica]NIJ24130.1 NodT family efflux transporter outer membrane factor (OMF) lipoprotein [Sphingomonas japonica]
MFARPFLVLTASALALAGCSVGPDYRPSSASDLGVPDAYSVAAPPAPQVDLTRWWAQFDDPLLGELVETATRDNLDVGQAVARLRQARESLVQARGSLLPSLSASGGYSRRQNLVGGTNTVQLPDGTIIETGAGSSDNFSIGGDASYQVDLFGGVRRSIEGASAGYEASAFDLASIRTAIQGEVARNYVLARAAQAQLANARLSLAIQDENLEIAGFRIQAGLVSSLDTEQARSQRAATAATIPSLEQSYAQSVARLGVLIGQAPGALRSRLEQPLPIPLGPQAIAVGIPADTLRQRPDVRAAERQLAAATAQVGVATAQLYPALSISGGLDTNATAISRIGDLVTGSLFAGLSQLIFDGGRTRSQVRAQEAATDAAFLAYRQTVLVALEDIENAIVALNTADARRAEITIQLDAANNSAILSRSQYRAGLTDFTTLNQTETTLLQARNSLTTAQSDRTTALIQLFGALGGGWDSTTLPGASASTTFRNGNG